MEDTIQKFDLLIQKAMDEIEDLKEKIKEMDDRLEEAEI